MIWTTAEVFLPYQHAGGIPEIYFLSTCAVGLCECNPEPVHSDLHLHEDTNKQLSLNDSIRKNKLKYHFIVFLRFIYSIFTEIFYYNILIIIIYNITKFNFNFKQHISTTNCHQVMSIKHNLPPIDTNYFYGGI